MRAKWRSANPQFSCVPGAASNTSVNQLPCPRMTLGVELHVRRILFERLQDQRARALRGDGHVRPSPEANAVIGDNHRDVAAFQLADPR